MAAISTALVLVTPLLGVLHGHFWSLIGLIIPALIFSYLFRDQDVRRAFRLSQ